MEAARPGRPASWVNGHDHLRLLSALAGAERGGHRGAAVDRNLDLLAGRAVAVVTGQQVNLFSGPAYTFYKALTAVRLAAENHTLKRSLTDPARRYGHGVRSSRPGGRSSRCG